MSVIYDKATTALIFDKTSPQERRTALMLLILFNVNDVRTITKIKERINSVATLKEIKFTAQEIADAIGLGMVENYFSLIIPTGSPTIAVTMAVGDSPVKVALEYPDIVILKIQESGTKYLKECKR
jgi:hypothetical protein